MKKDKFKGNGSIGGYFCSHLTLTRNCRPLKLKCPLSKKKTINTDNLPNKPKECYKYLEEVNNLF